MEYIQLKKDSIFRLGIKDADGNVKKDENGNAICIEIDLEDIEAPLRYSKSEFLVRKARNDLKLEVAVIDKKPDKKGNYLLSANDKLKIEATQKYYKTMEEAIDLFIGEGGTEKIFGKRRYWSMWEDFNELLLPYMDKLKLNMNEISNKIKGKYQTQENDVLKDE